MNTSKDIIERIQKLLALATSSNEHEAQIAASKAQELLVKYNLTEATVESYEADYTREDGEVYRRVAKVEWLIKAILDKYFFVDMVASKRGINGTRFIMLGKKHNVEIAKYVREFLRRAFDDAFKTFRTETGEPVSARDSFNYGMYKGICAQLDASKIKVEQQVGLVVVEDRALTKFTASNFPTLRSGGTATSFNTGNASALDAGRASGQSLRIGRGLQGQATQSNRTLKGN